MKSCLPYVIILSNYQGTENHPLILILAAVFGLFQIALWIFIGKTAWSDLNKSIKKSSKPNK